VNIILIFQFYRPMLMVVGCLAVYINYRGFYCSIDLCECYGM